MNTNEIQKLTLREVALGIVGHPEAGRIFKAEIDRRWGLIPVESRRFVCSMAGCEGVESVPYTEIDRLKRAKIRSFIQFSLPLIADNLVESMSFAVSQG